MVQHSNHIKHTVVVPSGIPAYDWQDIGLTLLYLSSSR